MSRPQKIIEADEKETGERFLNLPVRWLDAKPVLFRCENEKGHVSCWYVKSEALGYNACPACRLPVWTTFPRIKMIKEKILSFVRLCKRDCVSNVCLAEDFENFMNSSFHDAYDYFCSKGMIQTEQISDIKICKWIAEAHAENPSTSLFGLIGLVMKRSGGKLDPNHVKEVVYDYFKE